MLSIKQKFWLFLVCNLVLWSLVPLWRESLPMDTQEAMVWGKFCLFGTTKHPPLSGWLAYPFWLLFNHWDGAMYLLSQIFVALGVVYIYRLAREFLSESKAVLAALLQFGIIYYNFSSVEYNVNVISLALWPMCAFYFWRGYKENKWRDWLFFGLFAGLNVLNKYACGGLFAALGLFVLFNKDARKLFKNVKVYVSAIFALGIITPHLLWLYEHDFITFAYLSERSSGGNITSFWRHFAYPLKFLGAQILFSAAALITYGVFYWRQTKEAFAGSQDKSQFLLIVGLVPLAIWLTVSLISGNALKSMWGFPCLFMVGIMLFYFLPWRVETKQAQCFVATMAVWTTLFAVAYNVQIWLTKSERFHTNCPQVAAELAQIWNNETGGAPLKYVGGDVWYSDMLALYGANEIKPMIWLNPKANSWFDAADFAQKGALVVVTDEAEYGRYQQQYGHNLSAPTQLNLTFKNYFGKTKEKQIYYGFYRSVKENTDEK